MANLADELWRRILEMGVENSTLDFKDICSISITCSRLNELSSEDSLWYKMVREQKLIARRRAVWRIESEIAECSRKIREIELHCDQEREKMRNTLADLSNLHKVRQASVALKVWQPEIVRSRQYQVVEQSDIPAECRISALEMELRLCKIQITDYHNALKLEEAKLRKAREKLASLKYHPLNDFNDIEYNGRRRRKKMKH